MTHLLGSAQLSTQFTIIGLKWIYTFADAMSFKPNNGFNVEISENWFPSLALTQAI